MELFLTDFENLYARAEEPFDADETKGGSERIATEGVNVCFLSVTHVQIGEATETRLREAKIVMTNKKKKVDTQFTRIRLEIQKLDRLITAYRKKKVDVSIMHGIVAKKAAQLAADQTKRVTAKRAAEIARKNEAEERAKREKVCKVEQLKIDIDFADLAPPGGPVIPAVKIQPVAPVLVQPVAEAKYADESKSEPEPGARVDARVANARPLPPARVRDRAIPAASFAPSAPAPSSVPIPLPSMDKLIAIQRLVVETGDKDDEALLFLRDVNLLKDMRPEEQKSYMHSHLVRLQDTINLYETAMEIEGQ